MSFKDVYELLFDVLKLRPISCSSSLQVARMSGTGEQLYTVITNNHPSAETMMKSYRALVDSCPYVKLKHFLSTKAMLDACEGASRVHVIHYGALFGTEWPGLFLHLSMRPGGPPHFRLTGF